jgi:hypothetical protein
MPGPARQCVSEKNPPARPDLLRHQTLPTEFPNLEQAQLQRCQDSQQRLDGIEYGPEERWNGRSSIECLAPSGCSK